MNALFSHCGGLVNNSVRGALSGSDYYLFEESFDARECQSIKFILEKIKYILHNPVSKRCQLVNDFMDYEYSSASFYEKGIKKYEKLVHVNDVLQQF